MTQTSDPWAACVLTLFPDLFPGPLGGSVIGKALQDGIWSLTTVDIREFADDRHRTVDGPPAGGGPGMVLRADVVAAAIDSLGSDGRPLIYLSPRGAPLAQSRVRQLSEDQGAILLCGRFEGVDERVLQHREVEEISLGDFVLAGGEVAAMALIEAVVRVLPGVVGDADSVKEESFETGLLEYPHYTRPQEWEGTRIPDVLISGNHQRIRTWRREQSEVLTKMRRPDLWKRYQARTENEA